MCTIKQIHTREQLIHELIKIIKSHHYYDDLNYSECANEIANLISELSDPFRDLGEYEPSKV